MSPLRTAPACFALLALSASPTARAESRPPELAGPSVAALGGYGYGGGYDEYRVGLGVRAGYTFDYPMYVGATYLFHFGRKEDNPFGWDRNRAMMVGGELGHDVDAAPMLLRPYLGFGGVRLENTTYATNSGLPGGTTGPAQESTYTDWEPYADLGVLVGWVADPHLVLGADVRFHYVSTHRSEDESVGRSSLAGYGVVQFRF